ncbi:hypothetical protein GXY_14882, partial [Novacetimonas hansenii ATCC 23769]
MYEWSGLMPLHATQVNAQNAACDIFTGQAASQWRKNAISPIHGFQRVIPFGGGSGATPLKAAF